MDPINPVPDPSTITFAFLLTAVGAGVAAGLTTSIVALFDRAFPALGTRLTGAAQAFIVSLVIYILAAVATQAYTSLDSLLVVAIAWLTSATAAVGVHQVVARNALNS